MEKEPIVGKYLLEILTVGMYTNPYHAIREYIQNSCDSIDQAENKKLYESGERGSINISFDHNINSIIISDNGTGIPSKNARSTLLNIGASEKTGISERGFRGIGRLAGLAYAQKVIFKTSAKGESVATQITFDCKDLDKILAKECTEVETLTETIKHISHVESVKESKNEHYFIVTLEGVSLESKLMDEDEVKKYLQITAPIDFDSQSFNEKNIVNQYFEDLGYPIMCYDITFNNRRINLYKPYKSNMYSGIKKTNKEKEFIKGIEFFNGVNSKGELLYTGWFAKTDFKGLINDNLISRLHVRKDNILIGDGNFCDPYFGKEGKDANRCFAGEIYIIHNGLIPNSQRNDFEQNETFTEFKKILTDYLISVNQNYRRDASKANSNYKGLKEVVTGYEELEKEYSENGISSDVNRGQYQEKLDDLEKKRVKFTKGLERAVEAGKLNPERLESFQNLLNQSNDQKNRTDDLKNGILNTPFKTMNDLPSSYSKKEKHIYTSIISVIDDYFKDDPETATNLRYRIREKLEMKKKKK